MLFIVLMLNLNNKTMIDILFISKSMLERLFLFRLSMKFTLFR